MSEKTANWYDLKTRSLLSTLEVELGDKSTITAAVIADVVLDVGGLSSNVSLYVIPMCEREHS